MPYFSIITPSFNQGRYIEATIQSVLNQGDEDFEHIIVDGGSTDETLSVLRKYPHLKWTSEPDEGRASAVNKGFREARGEILAWLSSDDTYPEGVFRRVRAVFQEHPEINVVAGRAVVVGPEGKTLFFHELPEPEGLTHSGILRFWKYGTLPQPSVFFRRGAWEETGPLDERFQSYMDYDYMIRLSRRYVFFREPGVLSCIRSHDEAGTMLDLKNGKLHKRLYAISRSHWGGPGQKQFWKLCLSWLWHLPGVEWRAYYESFALRHKRELKNLFTGSKPLFFWRTRHLWARHPLAYCAAAAQFLKKRKEAQKQEQFS